MEKMVHKWKVKCRSCGVQFEHIFVATDLFKPHMFNELAMKCPECGATKFDPIHFDGKEPLQQWETEHPGMSVKSLPDHSYLETD